MKKVFLKKIGYVSICCFVHGPQGIFAVFFRCPAQGGNRGFLQCIFRHSWEGFETDRGLRGCFLLPGGEKGVSLKVLFCSWRLLQFFFGMPCTGAPVYFAGFFRYSLK